MDVHPCGRPACCPIYTGHSPNPVLMLGQHQRQGANIETALGECLMFAGMGGRPPTGSQKSAFPLKSTSY